MFFKMMLLSSVFWGSLALAKSDKPKDQTPEIKATMQWFLGSMKDLKPYMISYEKFSSPDNKEDLFKKIKAFLKFAEAGEPLELQTTPGFNVTYNLMSKHLREIEQLYSAGATESAWHRLNATGNFCIGCHSRLPRQVNSAAFDWANLGFESEAAKGNLQDAEFLFLSHQYLKSLEILNRLIATHSDPTNSGDLDLIFERKIYFFARIQRDPSAAVKSLKADLKNKKLPAQTQTKIKTWISAFNRLAKEIKSFPSSPTDAELLKKAKAMIQSQNSDRKVDLGDPQTISVLWISGLLYERVLKGGDAPDMPEFLYLLAKVERSFQTLRIYSLADSFLKQCVELFPKSPIAKSCFNDYSVSMKQKFRLKPEVIQNSIDALGKLLE